MTRFGARWMRATDAALSPLDIEKGVERLLRAYSIWPLTCLAATHRRPTPSTRSRRISRSSRIGYGAAKRRRD